MKQEAGKKKSKLWLWLVIGAVALIAAAGVVVALVLGGGEKDTGPKGGRPELYWNIDRKAYTENSESGLSTREAGEDGTFKVRFAINGEVVEYVVADKQLINYIDTMDAMGIVKDSDGTVVDVVDPKDIAKEVNKNAYVKTVSGNKIVANTSVAMNGMNINIKLEEGLTEIYDVTPQAEVPGQKITTADLKAMDTLVIYANDMDQVTHVYVNSHSKESKVYWRADQLYSSADKSTTREPDANGAYTIPFFCEGEVVELKCKDKAIVTKIDSISRWKCHFGFTFDEEGYIIEQYASAIGIQGVTVADCWDIVEIDGDTYTIQRLTTNDGSVWTGTIPAGTTIYEAGVKAKREGQGGRKIDSLQMGDRVTVWTNTSGEVVLVYVAERLVDSPAYWSPSRKYSSTKKETTREIGPSGYYEIELYKEGTNKKEIYYVKDKETMSYMDSITAKIMGLKVLPGNIVEYAYNEETLTGYTTATRGGVVTAVTGGIFTKMTYGKRGTESNMVLAANARVWNVSGYGQYGEATTVMPGDHIYAVRQPTGEILIGFITKRTVGAEHMYWNLELMWDKENKTSTRVPDADGWYHFTMAHMGKQVQLKTKDKKLVDKIDGLSIGATGLDVSGSVITNVFDAGYPYGGNKVASGYKFQYVTSEGKYYCEYASDAKKTVEFVMAEDCVIYDVSPVFDKFKGERIYSIPKNAMLTVFCDIYGEAKVVYVRSKSVKDMYWKTEILYDSTNKVTKRVPDADGYYWYDLAVNGECKRFKTKDQKIANSMDSYAGAFGLHVRGDEIIAFVSTSGVQGVSGNGYITASVVAINGRTITVEASGKTETMKLTSDCKIYDVSPVAEKFGQVSTLKVGDVIRTYLNKDKSAHSYVYIKSRASRVKGEVGYCEHCKAEVKWKPMDGNSAISTSGGHWYVPANLTAWVQSTWANKNKDITVCLDLNGKVLTRSENGRNFRVAEGDTLNIMDSVGGGKVVSSGGTGFSGGIILMSAGGTVNMYGGTLEFVQKDIKNGNGGVVNMSGAETTFNLYDGKITGGTVYAKDGKSQYGGNFYIASGATLNMYDGEISNGTVYGMMYESVDTKTGDPKYTAVAPYGGNIYMTESSMVNILGGVVKDGKAVRETFTASNGQNYTNMSYGGNIYKVNTNKLNGQLYIENATVSGGQAHRGGNINAFASSGGSGGIVVLNKATITGGRASQFGGNIMSNCATWAVVDSKITDGAVIGSTGSGGNIYSQGGVYAVENTVISGGQAPTSGGNVNLYKNKYDDNAFVIYDGTVIENGVAPTGGNINVQSKNYVQLADGTVVAPAEDDGTGVALLPVLGIVGGEIKGGEANTGADIYSAGHMTLQGGVVSGEIYFSGNKEALLDIAGSEVGGEFMVKNPLEFTISGAPKLANLTFDKNVKATVGEMTEGASVKVTTTAGSPVFTTAFGAAQQYKDAGYFTGVEEGSEVYVTANSELALEPAPLQTKTIFCNHCNQEVAFVEWTYGSGSYTREDGHFFLMADETISANHRIGNSSSDKAADGVDVVLDLNGHNITSSGPVFYVYPYSTLTVQDSVGTSVVSGKGTIRSSKPGEGGVFYAEGKNAKLNIYGGTFTLEDTDKVSNGGVIRNGGTTKIYGGTFNGNTVTGVGSAIYSTSVLEVYGGTFNGEVNIKGSVTLDGAPVIETLTMQSGALATLGELTAGADITVIAEGVFTKPNANAQAYKDAGYIKSGTSTEITVTPLDELAIGEVIIEGLLEYACPHCNGAIAKWIPYDANKAATDNSGVLVGNNAHYYIPDGGYNQTYGQVSIQGNVTLDLHGQTLLGKGSSDGSVECKRLWRIEGIFNILDTVGGGKAVAYGLKNGGGALAMTRANPDNGDKAVINLYSGTLTMTADCQTGSSGGILSLAGGTVMNMYGGEIYGGKATREHAQNIYIGDGTLNMQGGFIDGGVELTSAGTINLSGTAKIGQNNGGLWIAKDKLIGLGAMETGAEVYVAVDETAVITDVLTNANDFMAYIKPAVTGWNVANSGNALLLTNGEAPFDPNTVYQQAAAMDFTTNDPDGKVNAVCPVCREEVEWNILPANTSGASNTTLESGHYYLSETVDYTQNKGLYSFTGGKQICINLNGRQLTTTKRAFYTETTSTTLNIMGEGIVSGPGELSGTTIRAVLDLTANTNLYGGTYISTRADYPAIENRKSSAGDAVVSIYAGTTVINEAADGIALNLKSNGQLAIYGGTITGKVQNNGTKGITVSGAPVINALDLTNGKKITVGELTSGANITVLANGIFTEAFDDAQAYKDAEYFVSGVEDTKITVEGNALTVAAENAVDPNEVYEAAKAMDFSAGGTVTAKCPVCGIEVDWSALPVPSATANHKLAAGHYYVAEDIVTEKYRWTIDASTGGVVCVNLNGKSLTNNSERVFYAENAANVLNIMGEGTVTGCGGYNAVNTNYFGVIDLCTAANLYGGTYTSTNEYPVVTNRGSGVHSVLNIYEGTQIVRTTEDAQGLNLFIADRGTVNMYDGLISGGTAIEHPELNVGKSGGNVLMKANRSANNLGYTCSFNLYGGIVENGTAENLGGNIAAIGSNQTKPVAVVNICGGEVKNGSVCANGNNASVNLSGDPVVDHLDMAAANLINVGELKKGASIKVVAGEGAPFTTAIAANAETYAEYFYADGTTADVIVKDNALVVANVCPHCKVEMANIDWQPIELTSGMKIEQGGHFYLDQNYEGFTSQIGIKGGDVVIDFRGHTITTSGRGFYVGDENLDIGCSLSLMDTMGTGGVTATYTNGGGVLYVITAKNTKMNTMNIYGGNYANTGNPANGGCVMTSRSDLNIYGGTFTGAEIDADKKGANLYSNGGTVNIYGGTFTEGNANGLGDCAYIEDYVSGGVTWQGVLNIHGGSFDGQVFIEKGAEISIEGAPVFTALELDEAVKIALGELTKGADITVKADGAFTTANAEADAYVEAGYIKPVENHIITEEENVLYMAAVSLLKKLANALGL